MVAQKKEKINPLPIKRIAPNKNAATVMMAGNTPKETKSRWHRLCKTLSVKQEKKEKRDSRGAISDKSGATWHGRTPTGVSPHSVWWRKPHVPFFLLLGNRVSSAAFLLLLLCYTTEKKAALIFHQFS